jgi:antitoxin ParD1/3/4
MVAWSGRIYRADHEHFPAGSDEDFVDHQVASGRYSSVSEYVRELIREDEKRRAEDKLEALLLEGLNSGDPIEVTPEYWERKRQQLTKRHQQRNSGR